MYVCIVFRGRSKRDVISFDVSRIHRELWRSKEKDSEGPMIYGTALGVVISHSNSNAPLLDGVACGGSARLLPWGGFEVNGLLPRGSCCQTSWWSPCFPWWQCPSSFEPCWPLETGRCWRQHHLHPRRRCRWRRLHCSSFFLLESLWFESSSFSVIKRWREEGSIRCNLKNIQLNQQNNTSLSLSMISAHEVLEITAQYEIHKFLLWHVQHKNVAQKHAKLLHCTCSWRNL